MKLRSGGGAALSSVGHHAEILRGGPEAWNAWRKKRPSTIPHLTGVVLAASERELGGESGTPINLKSARLKEAVFRFATLSAANLQAADLAHADLVHARLIHANLSEATLQSAALDHADFSGAVLLHADLRGASLRFATLAGADLKGADLSGADLAHARLAHTNLAGANLRRAVLDYADFAGADLSQTDLSGARLDNVRNLLTSQLEESLGDSATILPSHLRGCVPWSAIGGETPVPLLNPAEFWLLQARRDLRRQTFYGQTVRVAGVLVVGAAVATGLVTETAHDTLPGAPAEAKKSVEPTLSVLPAMDEQASALSMPAATRLEAAVPPPSLATIPADLVRPAAPAQSAIVEPADAPVPSEAADPPSETISQVVGAVALRVTQEAEDRLETSATKEELPASEFSTVFNLPAAAPVTLTLASTTLSPLKAGQSAVAALRTRMPKIPTLVRASLRPKVVKQARAIMPAVAAFDDPKTPAPAAAAAVPEPMMLVVSLDAQKVDIYRGIKHVASAKISSGMPGYDTKLGVFSILEKKRRHHSNLYSGAPMPFMQRLTRSGTALHAGAIPGYPASHGCVRLPYSFAPKLFEMTSVGQNVVVTRGRPVPTRIEHPNLFELPPPKPPVAMAASVAVPRLLTDAVAVSTESDDDDHAIAAFHSDAPLRMLVTRRTAHDRVMAVQYMLADLGYLARQNFIGNLGPATGNAIRAFQKANGLPVTGAFTDELVRQVYRAAGKTEPPEGYLFVRQGFKRVFDLPISFRDPAVSLGTHVFTVVKRGDAAKPEWMAVSLEGGDAASVLD
ncbi:pentapeptide repeat-containing protein, partial [Methyloceanibacter sp.]|uniref:pentapeptide repeat-containing protein n=1 Tax=Methyloceanibacter sp. TaxID=1965321 RepID=UPI00351B288E